MRRRDLLKAGIGAAAALAAPRIGGAAAAKTLVVRAWISSCSTLS